MTQDIEAAVRSLAGRIEKDSGLVADRIVEGSDGCFHAYYFGAKKNAAGGSLRYACVGMDCDGDAAWLTVDRETGSTEAKDINPDTVRPADLANRFRWFLGL